MLARHFHLSPFQAHSVTVIYKSVTLPPVYSEIVWIESLATLVTAGEVIPEIGVKLT